MKKKDGKNYFNIDRREHIKSSFQAGFLFHFDELVKALNGATIISKLDLGSAYINYRW